MKRIVFAIVLAVTVAISVGGTSVDAAKHHQATTQGGCWGQGGHGIGKWC